MSTSGTSQRVGFIGTGVMGRSMALNLINAGYHLTVYNRTEEKAKDVMEAGAAWAESAGAAAAGGDFVITIVGFPDDVHEVYLGAGGILSTAKAGAVVIDMTTSKPSLAKEIHEAAAGKGIATLDAPVSGGDIGARNATLSIMVGGDREAYDRAMPLFRAMGKTIVYQGPAGSGQHTKMCNQITLAATMIGVMEALLYAQRSGLDPETVLESIGSGAAASWALSNLQPRALAGDFEPGFYVCHFLKDIEIALGEAEGMGIATPGLSLAKKLYDQVVELGGEFDGTQAIYKVLEYMSA